METRRSYMLSTHQQACGNRLKSTYLHTRILRNPARYGVPTGLSEEKLDAALKGMLRQTFEESQLL